MVFQANTRSVSLLQDLPFSIHAHLFLTKAFSMVPIKHLVSKGASYWNVALSLAAGKDKRTVAGTVYKASPDHWA